MKNLYVVAMLAATLAGVTLGSAAAQSISKPGISASMFPEASLWNGRCRSVAQSRDANLNDQQKGGRHDPEAATRSTTPIAINQLSAA